MGRDPAYGGEKRNHNLQGTEKAENRIIRLHQWEKGSVFPPWGERREGRERLTPWGGRGAQGAFVRVFILAGFSLKPCGKKGASAPRQDHLTNASIGGVGALRFTSGV